MKYKTYKEARDNDDGYELFKIMFKYGKEPLWWRIWTWKIKGPFKLWKQNRKM